MLDEPEKFMLRDSAAKKNFPLREATDIDLQKALAATNAKLTGLGAQVNALMEEVGRTYNLAGAISYEIDRRARTLTLATPGDLAALDRKKN